MAFDGAGTYTQPADTAAVVRNTISPSAFNTLIADIAAALSKMICKDGQSTPTANIPLGGNKITGLGNATALTDAMNLLNFVNQAGIYCAVGGTVDVITLTPTPAWTSYAAGRMVTFLASGANTGAVTVNVSGLGAVALVKNGTTALGAGDIPAAGALVIAVHNGTQFTTKI
jgi:hypothetical protein